MVETCSWLTDYFYKVVFLTVVSLFLFNLQHNGMHKIKVILIYLLIYQLTGTRQMHFRITENVR